MSQFKIEIDLKTLNSHHVSDFDPLNGYTILRRGQQFSIIVSTTDTSILLEQYHVKEIYLSFPVKNSASTSIILPASNFRMMTRTAASLLINVTFDPLQTPVGGPTSMYVVIEQAGGPTRRRKSSTGDEGSATKVHASESEGRIYSLLCDSPLVVLFNPWCKEDSVYLNDDRKLNEYLLNENGQIWWGGKRPRAWYFGQFDSHCLHAFLEITNEMTLTERRSPILMLRAISYHVNNRILEGNWSGNYAGGKNPTSWHGSSKILQVFVETNKIVKYGQCWVFSGVLTTLCRTSGIPARSVTNYSSAHDYKLSSSSNQSGTLEYNRLVDIYVDETGNLMEDKTLDSIWNFHVWNEIWAHRSDLRDNNFDGWQAVDSTPQELSDGKYQCGPSPVFAIKNGKNVKYDTIFLYGEVNADRVVRQKQSNGTFKEVGRNTKMVGQFISTKTIGKNSREDLTLNYKEKEGSIAERNSFNSIVGDTKTAKESDVSVTFDLKDIEVGEDGKGTLKVHSNVNEERTISVTIKGHLARYNGPKIADIFTTSGSNIKIGPKESTEFEVFVNSNYYEGFVFDEIQILAYTFVKIHENNSTYVSIDDAAFTIKPPKIELPVVVNASETFEIKVSYVNPLKSTTLTNLELELDPIRNVTKGFEKIISSSLAPGALIEDTISISLAKPGKYDLEFELNADQISSSSVTFIVTVN